MKILSKSLFLFLLFFNIFKKCDSIELRIFENLLEVRSQTGLYFPLCSNSFSQKYGEEACSSISSSFISYSVIPLSQYSYSIGCTSNVCFTFLSSFCKTGIEIFCQENTNQCAAGTTQIGEKCLYISNTFLNDFSSAKIKWSHSDYTYFQQYCAPFSLANSLKLSEIETIKEILLTDQSSLFYTSGLRKGSTWQWGNEEQIEGSEFGENGRCLGFLNDILQSVDCNSKGFAICETGRECIGKRDDYQGTMNQTSQGVPCLKWNDPSILFENQNALLFSHNFCRYVEQNGKNSSSPMCYISPGKLENCSIPKCPGSQQDHVETEDVCEESSFSCDNGSRCISQKFQCDYEVDCSDGSDERNCDDFLQYYELFGAYRLAENIIEVWTFIPHVQGCARKCRESLLVCEAFSYESKTQTCLLTDTSHTRSSLAQKITSLYYRRRFSSKDVQFEVSKNILYARKNQKKGIVCDEDFSRDKLSSICRILGFGDSMYSQSARPSSATSSSSTPVTFQSTGWPMVQTESPPSSARSHHRHHRAFYDDNGGNGAAADADDNDDDGVGGGGVVDGDYGVDDGLDSVVGGSADDWIVRRVASSSPSLSYRRHSRQSTHLSTQTPHRQTWNLSCLREPNCTETQLSTCQPIRCSYCADVSCHDGTCLKYEQLCDGHVDCEGAQADDELDCRAKSFRLVNGTDTTGYVEVLFRSKWQPVCNDELTISNIASLCDAMRLGRDGKILQTNESIDGGWNLICDVDCEIRRAKCTQQARISCTAENMESQSKCGLRYVEVNAKDAARARIARVVGGFETLPGAFPWTAALRLKSTGEHHCGASVLDSTHLITAAHCFEEDKRAQSYEIVTGDWNNNATDGSEQVVEVKRIHFYPLFKDIFSHDIAVVEIAYPGIRFDQFTQPICLPSREFVYSPGRQCVVSGWGSMGLSGYAQKLQAALIPIIDRFECVNSSQIYQSMSRSAFCAGYLEGGIDSCQGDSGGPFACRRQDGAFILAGVISWGDGCAQKKQPGIYTMVAPYISWINSILDS